MKLIAWSLLALLIALVLAGPGMADPTNKAEWYGPTTVFYSPGGTYQYPNSSPAATSRYPGEIDVFFFDTTNMSTSGSVLRQTRYVFNGIDSSYCWANPTWTDVGAPLPSGTNPLAATSMNPDRIDLFARGAGGYLYQTSYLSPSWAPSWSKPGGEDFSIVAHTGPIALSPSPSTLDVFWISPDYHVRWLHWNGASWEYSTGTYKGTDLGSPPPGVSIEDGSRPGAASAPGHPERIDLFVRGQDNRIWQKTRMGTSWSGWSQVPGGSDLLGPPSAISRYPGCIDLVYGTTWPTDPYWSAALREWNITRGWGNEINPFTLSPREVAVAWSQYRIDVLSIEPQLCWFRRWNSPLPEIQSVTGSRGNPGDSSVRITLTGRNFFPGNRASVVHYETTSLSKNLTTTFVNETCLTASIPSLDLASEATITVINPSDGVLGGGSSNAVLYEVVYPPPAIDGTLPPYSPIRETGFDLILNGRNFYEGISKVYVNGVQRSSATWQAPTQFFVPLTAFEVNHQGSLSLEVRTPEPDGSFASSNTYSFPVHNPDYGRGVFRPSSWTNWILDRSMDGTADVRDHYGSAADKPLAGDFNRDGIVDRALFRSGEWIIDYSTDGSINSRPHYGQAGDIPLVGRMNADGTADWGVFRNGQWILDYSMDGSVNLRNNYGIAGDIPLIGDFNNDGTPDRAVFRPSSPAENWIIDLSMDGTVNLRSRFGQNGDIPVVGDFNRDGATDRAVFRRGEWIIDYSMDGSINSRPWYGMAGDIPLAWNL